MSYLAYNGKFLTRMGKWLGTGSPTPVPRPASLTEGSVRFKFDNTNMTVQYLYDNIFDNYYCTVAQVLDIDTGLPIPGLFDVRPYRFSDFQQNYKGALSIENCGGRVDLVNAYLSTAPTYFWQQAFRNSTAIRNISISYGVSVNRQTFTNFVDGSAAETIDLDYDGHAIDNTAIGTATLNKVTLRNITGTVPDNIFDRTTITTLELFPYMAQSNTAVFGPRTTGDTLASFINIYTLRAPGTSYAFSTGANSNLFSGKGVKELHAFGHDAETIPGIDLWPEIDLLLPNNCSQMFKNCPIEHLSRFRFDCTNLTNASEMFYGNTMCEDGIVDTYNVLSAKLTGSYGHAQTFRNCGSGTTTGAAELAQIPSDWK